MICIYIPTADKESLESSLITKSVISNHNCLTRRYQYREMKGKRKERERCPLHLIFHEKFHGIFHSFFFQNFLAEFPLREKLAPARKKSRLFPWGQQPHRESDEAGSFLCGKRLKDALPESFVANDRCNR